MIQQHRTAISALALMAIFGTLFLLDNLLYHQPTESPVVTPAFVGVPPEIVYGDRTKKQVIFTFDGGSGAASGPAILDALKKHNVRGTFFLTGLFILHNPDLVRRMVSEGHEVYNHSYNHPHLTEISDNEIISQLGHTNSLLRMIAGTSTKPYFRPPYGSRDDRVRTVAAKEGYQSVFWTVDALDWMAGDSGNGDTMSDITADTVRSIVLSNITPGAIFLMHIGDRITGDILDDLFNEVEARGYKLVSLTEGM